MTKVIHSSRDILGGTPVFHSSRDILGGTPVFEGTRVPVKTLFDHLEAMRLRCFWTIFRR